MSEKVDKVSTSEVVHIEKGHQPGDLGEGYQPGNEKAGHQPQKVDKPEGQTPPSTGSSVTTKPAPTASPDNSSK